MHRMFQRQVYSISYLHFELLVSNINIAVQYFSLFPKRTSLFDKVNGNIEAKLDQVLPEPCCCF